MCDDDGCVVTVRWKEPFISCDGSVCRYVLTVTPPTCDCESSEDCMLVDNAAVYFVPGNETQYDIAVNGNMSLEYDVTVRADTCDSTVTLNDSAVTLTGDLSPVYNFNVSGTYNDIHKTQAEIGRGSEKELTSIRDQTQDLCLECKPLRYKSQTKVYLPALSYNCQVVLMNWSPALGTPLNMCHQNHVRS